MVETRRFQSYGSTRFALYRRTDTHDVTGIPSAAAALRYTSGKGLKRGGSKSLSPLWIFSSGKKSRSRAVSTQTGTRGLGDVVAIAYLKPEM
jgi:hypothetical protein